MRYMGNFEILLDPYVRDATSLLSKMCATICDNHPRKSLRDANY